MRMFPMIDWTKCMHLQAKFLTVLLACAFFYNSALGATSWEEALARLSKVDVNLDIALTQKEKQLWRGRTSVSEWLPELSVERRLDRSSQSKAWVTEAKATQTIFKPTAMLLNRRKEQELLSLADLQILAARQSSQADLMSAFMLLEILQDELGSAKTRLELVQKNFESYRQGFAQGRVSQLDFNLQQESLLGLEADLADTERQLRERTSAFCILLQWKPEDCDKPTLDKGLFASVWKKFLEVDLTEDLTPLSSKIQSKTLDVSKADIRSHRLAALPHLYVSGVVQKTDTTDSDRAPPPSWSLQAGVKWDWGARQIIDQEIARLEHREADFKNQSKILQDRYERRDFKKDREDLANQFGRWQKISELQSESLEQIRKSFERGQTSALEWNQRVRQYIDAKNRTLVVQRAAIQLMAAFVLEYGLFF